MAPKSIAPGVWKICLGEPEDLTPLKVLPPTPATEYLSKLPALPECPLDLDRVSFRKTSRGFEVHLPLDSKEQIYGLGLQLLSFNQTGLKKTLRVNSDPRCDLGDSHAPVPFYVTTGGYGVLADTARYATFYAGSAIKVTHRQAVKPDRQFALSTDILYEARHASGPRQMLIEIPGAAGVELYIFGGPTLGGAVQRYNLFSGGGCVPPRWALGHWYRVRGDFSGDQITEFAARLREEQIPCDVIGVEPGWQTHAYSCSHRWSDKFPDPALFLAALRKDHFQVNLWTHAFTHPSSPIYESLLPFAGDHTVFGGIVPDFSVQKARKIFNEHYRQTIVGHGVSGLKIDECDNSDFIHSPWSFPELSQFPSGMDGEQMHSLFGMLLQSSTEQLYHSADRRTFGLIRNSHALAAAKPFALYSDLYDHRQFVRGIANASFSGLLWCPEVRESSSGEELLRRLQTAAVSPLMQINGWYIANPPWKHWEVEANNKGERVADWEEWQERCRRVLELRMRLIPYLHSAFFNYRNEGTPPFRALVLDYPEQEECWNIDDQFLIGDRLMAAPQIEPGSIRRLWLPPGSWADFWTGEAYQGGRFLDYRSVNDQVPLFVKAGSVLPLARPTLHVEEPDSFQLEVVVFGNGSLPATLIEESEPEIPFDAEKINVLTIVWNSQQQHLACERQKLDFQPLYSVASIRFQ